MPIADIVIAAAIAISVLVGFLRGFVKEAISIAALLIAVWASLNFGDDVGTLSGGWLGSAELQVWFGRALVFIVITIAGGLFSWLIAKRVRLSILSGTDRALGMLFGFGRGVVLAGVFAFGGQYAEFNESGWWQRSALMPYAEQVADWLRIMAPKGVEFIQSTPDIVLPLDRLGSPVDRQ